MANKKITSNFTFGDKWSKTTIKAKDFLAGKDSIREPLRGLYHSDGNIVASNAYIMAVLKNKYPKSNEGKIIFPDGKVADNLKYPNYHYVIERAKKDYDAMLLPDTLVKSMIDGIKHHPKPDSFAVRFSCLKGVGFRLSELLKMLRIAKMCASPAVYLHKDGYTMHIEADGLFATLSMIWLDVEEGDNIDFALYDVDVDTCKITYNEKAVPLEDKH